MLQNIDIKDSLSNLKSDTNYLFHFIRNQNEKETIKLLNKLGRLNDSSCSKPLQELLHSNNDEIRRLAVKNLAKIKDQNLYQPLMTIISFDKSSKVRTEAVSALGRYRDKDLIPVLCELLDDSDPQIILQAVRGLAVFCKSDADLNNRLKALIHHPNELVKQVIEVEIHKDASQKKVKGEHKSPDFLKNKIVHADVIDAINYMPNDSIHLTFTSPPYYNARDYSIYKSYPEYLHLLEKVFTQVYRVTKEGRFFVINTSPVIMPRVSRSYSSKRYPIPYDIHPILTKIGWEFVDDIIWLKPEASVKNRNAGFLQHRKPLGYKPNSITEMVMVYRKKTDKLIDWNMKQYDNDIIEKSKVTGEYETSNVWKIDPVFHKLHTAVFPKELCNKIIKYYSFVGDVIFDPFAGSGTLGKSAIELNRYFFLSEQKKEYVQEMKEYFLSKNKLFNQNPIKIETVSLKQFIHQRKQYDLNRASR